MTGLLKGVRHEEDAGRRGDADNRRQRQRGVDWCGERGYPRQPVGLKRASGTDPSEDILPGGATRGGKVSDFYADGMVSAEVNSHYGNLDAVQQKYAPFGIETGLCVGLASVAYQNEGLTLQPCDDPTTVWVIYPAPPATTGGYFPIVNATTTDFSRPFAIHLPRNEVPSRKPLQMQVRHLQFRTGEKTLPARQLWALCSEN